MAPLRHEYPGRHSFFVLDQSYDREHEQHALLPRRHGSWIGPDDPRTIFLSTDADAANKREIARDNAWDNPWEWTISAGAANIGLKGSSTWTNAASGGVPPFANGINLVAGTRYYIEVNH